MQIPTPTLFTAIKDGAIFIGDDATTVYEKIGGTPPSTLVNAFRCVDGVAVGLDPSKSYLVLGCAKLSV